MRQSEKGDAPGFHHLDERDEGLNTQDLLEARSQFIRLCLMIDFFICFLGGVVVIVQGIVWLLQFLLGLTAST